MRNILLVILALTVVSCGDKKDPEGLNGDQKSRFNRLLVNVGNTQSAAERANRTLRSGKVTPGQEFKVSSMAKMLSPNNCEVSVSGMEPEGGNSWMKMDMRIKVASRLGERCPMNNSFRFWMDMNQRQMLSGMNWQLSVDEDFARVSDVTKIDLVADTRVFFHNNSISGSVSGDGEIVSQEFGRVKVSVSGNVSGQQYSQTWKFQMADFSAELTNTVTQDNKSFYLNGAPISEKEYMGYFNKMMPASSSAQGF